MSIADLSYLTREQLKIKDEKTLLQLKDCKLADHARNCKIAISEMFTNVLKFLKFAADGLLKWFNRKFKSNNLELRTSGNKEKIQN